MFCLFDRHLLKYIYRTRKKDIRKKLKIFFIKKSFSYKKPKISFLKKIVNVCMFCLFDRLLIKYIY